MAGAQKAIIKENGRRAEDQERVYERFVDSQPILDMLAILKKAGRQNFHEQGAWEICFCALVLKLDPQCKTQRLMEALSYSDRPMDSVDFLNTMAHLGYYCRTVDTAIEDVDERLMPAVFIPHEGMPSIILGRNQELQLQFYDPISNLVSSVPPSFERGGRVWFFQKYDENRQSISKFMRKGSGHSWFRALLGRFKGTFAQVMVAGLILNIMALATPLFIMLVYDRVIAAGAVDTLPMLALGAFIAIGFEWKLRHIRSAGLSWLAGRLDNVVSNRIFAHLIGLSPDLIEKASVAAQIARIKTFESVRDFFSGSVFLSLLEAPFVFLSLIAITFIAGPLVFVPLGMVAAYFLLFVFIRQKVKVVIRLAAKGSSARQQFTIETFEKLEGIRVYGLGGKWQEKFRHLSGREMMSHFYLAWLGMVAETCAHALTIIAAVATVGSGVHLIWAGTMTTGALVATMILVWRVLTPFYSMCTMIPRLEQLRNSIAQVNDLLDIDTEAEEAKSYSRLPSLKGGVSFHNVGLRYGEDSDDVFANLSFEAKPGDMVAITGGNGCGKTDVLTLIKSMRRTNSGTVRIDGFDIRQLDIPDLRRQIAYIPKNPHFFHGTVIENMRFANPAASENDVIKALQLADIWDDVRSMPAGLQSVIGMHEGMQPTSSQASRMSLARAYLHPSSLLLIDELPNTLLSGKAGENLKDYLVRAKGKRTVLICTYREDFMRLADTIVWLRGMGMPVAGPREEMFSKMNEGGAVA